MNIQRNNGIDVSGSNLLGRCIICGTTVTKQFTNVYLSNFGWVCDDCDVWIINIQQNCEYVYGIKIPYIEDDLSYAFCVGVELARKDGEL